MGRGEGWVGVDGLVGVVWGREFKGALESVLIIFWTVLRIAC